MEVFFGFSTSSWWVSRLIRRATASEVSHAFVYVRGTDLGDVVLEAGWDGWRASTLGSLTSGTTRVVELIPTPPAMRDAVEAAVRRSMRRLGEAYDYEGLLGMAWVELAKRWFHRKVLNPLRSARSMFCSDAVVELILQPAGWPGAFGLDPQSTSPADLRRFMKQT